MIIQTAKGNTEPYYDCLPARGEIFNLGFIHLETNQSSNYVLVLF